MPDAITLSDGSQIVSLRYAARIAGVAERTIRTWDQQGLLPHRAIVARTRYYRRADVMSAEASTRRRDPTRKRLRALLASTQAVGHTGF